jgi:hypothetical protein
MSLIESVSGDEAQNLISQLHPGPLAPAESQVGFYAAGDDRAVLYLSRFAEADSARAQLEMMSAMIGRGRAGFGHHTEIDMAGTVVHAVVGSGRMHFFFTRQNELVWLAADPALARAALAELLGVEVESMPR